MRIKAYAKINLTLDILGKRENGYHDIYSVMQTVSLFDGITVKKSNDLKIVCSDASIPEEENIALSAAKAFFEYTEISGGAEIKITKGIPSAAGLGGGSADAAAVIKALNRLYKTDLSAEELAKIGLKVGADVPFLIYGKTAAVKGIGELIKPLKPIKDYHCVIVKDGEKESTADMYKRIDAVKQDEYTTEDFITNYNNGVFKISCIKNAFSAVSEHQKVISAFKQTNCLCASLSGSGPSVFALYSKKGDAKSAAKQIKDMGYSPIVCEFI